MNARLDFTGSSKAGAEMSEAERQFWAEAGMQPEDLRDAVAERPASAGGSSASGGPLTAAEQQAFWAEAGISPEELGIEKAGELRLRPSETHFWLQLCLAASHPTLSP